MFVNSDPLWYYMDMRLLANDLRMNELIEALGVLIDRNVANQSSDKHAEWAIVGIRTRGDVLAKRLAKKLRPNHIGTLDITLYRDDLSEIGPQPVVRTTDISFGIDGINIVLVDDVIMTGRSVRAAIQSLMDLGRPRRIWLSVLVDRGGRELPIAPDHVAIDLSLRAVNLFPADRVEVHMQPIDACDEIVVTSQQEREASSP